MCEGEIHIQKHGRRKTEIFGFLGASLKFKYMRDWVDSRKRDTIFKKNELRAFKKLDFWIKKVTGDSRATVVNGGDIADFWVNEEQERD